MAVNAQYEFFGEIPRCAKRKEFRCAQTDVHRQCLPIMTRLQQCNCDEYESDDFNNNDDDDNDGDDDHHISESTTAVQSDAQVPRVALF